MQSPIASLRIPCLLLLLGILCVSGRAQGPDFATSVFYPTGTLALRAASGDFNHDGIPDLAISGDGGYSILLGHGDGSFGASSDAYIGGVQSSFLFTGDFNGDGKIDLLLPAYMNSVWQILLIPGNGDGTFGTPVVVVSGVSFNGSAIGDFNQDGALDLAGSDPVDGSVTVYLNDGHGSFASPGKMAAGAQADALTLTDVNHDGKLDIVAAAYSTPDIWVLLGNGDGTFQAPKHSSSGTGSVEQDSIASGDVDGDGIVDLAVTAYQFPSHVSQVVVLKGQGDGTFSVSGTYPTATAVGLIALADINRDGHLDLVGWDPAFAVLVNKGDGTFGPEIDFPIQPFLTSLSLSWVITDLNGDGKPDVALATAGMGGVWVALNTSAPGAYLNPVFTAASVVNAASYSSQISPGSLGVLFGVNLTSISGVLSGTGATWPTSLAGTSLTVGGYPAPIAAIANVNGQEQINFQVPWELGVQYDGAEIVVTNNGKASQPIEVPLLDAPGLFSQDGIHPIALRVKDFSLVTDANPALRGEAIVLYATGLGPVNPAWPTDTPASATTLSKTVTPIELTLNSQQGMTILFSGLAPGYIGLYQINAIVPTEVPPGELTLNLSNGWQGNTLNLPVR